jgi:hypothetical protein
VTRVYLPATLPLLRQWLAAAEIPAATTGFAVTAGLRAWYGEADDEELEHAATARAARASLRLLGDGSEARRVVVAVDADDPTVRDDLDEGAVVLGAALPWSRVRAGLVDDSADAEVVAAAVAAVDAADLGDLDADLVVGEAEDRDLLWYATQELADL